CRIRIYASVAIPANLGGRARIPTSGARRSGDARRRAWCLSMCAGIVHLPSRSAGHFPMTNNSADEADPRFEPVIAALSATPGFSIMQSKSRALRGLMLNGKSFGMSSHGRLILKLTPDRAEALIAAGVGVPFAMSPGRVAKGWIDVTAPDADWLSLAKE